MTDKKRLIFIDLLRGWALIVMIEVHVFNSMLSPQFRASSWFPFLNFVNGLVAPSFLFVSGFAFILASRSKLPQFKEYGEVFKRQIGRIFLIFVVGYSLHLPFLSIHKVMLRFNTKEWLDFMNVDVLQCIAVGLTLLFASRMFIKKEANHLAFIILSGAVFVMAAPLLWLIDFRNYIPLFFANYINPMGGSLFPLFPWLGFMLAGAATAYFYLQAKEGNKEEEFKKRITFIGIISIVIGHLTLIESLPFFIRMHRPNWLFFVLRLGYVFVFLAMCIYYEEKKHTKKSFVLDMSRESLLVYWLHLQVLFRKVWNNSSIESAVKNDFGLMQCIASTIGLIVLMLFAARAWSKVKRDYPMTSKWIFWGVFALGALIFFLA